MFAPTDRLTHCSLVKLCTCIILWTGFLFSNGCIADRQSNEKISIVNNSDQRISFCDSRSYPDTSLNETYDSGCDVIAPHSTCIAQTKSGWSAEINRNKYGIIVFFISSHDTIIKYGGDKWRRDYLILKRYDLTKDSLQKLNWTITYP